MNNDIKPFRPQPEAVSARPQVTALHPNSIFAYDPKLLLGLALGTLTLIVSTSIITINVTRPRLGAVPGNRLNRQARATSAPATATRKRAQRAPRSVAVAPVQSRHPVIQPTVASPLPIVTDTIVTPTMPQLRVNVPTPNIAGVVDLTSPVKKDLAMQLVSSAENSTLDWKAQYSYIEDIGDGRGYTGGIVGFTSGTHDMLEVVASYAKSAPGNVLAKYLPALTKVDGSASHAGLDPNFAADWKTAAKDPAFQKAQDEERDRVYFNPSVTQAKADGLRALGQFIYYDAIVMHGPGSDSTSFDTIRRNAISRAKTPATGGDEASYLNAFLDARRVAMSAEAAHTDMSRVDTEQRLFVAQGNFDLALPLNWKTYGDTYTIGK